MLLQEEKVLEKDLQIAVSTASGVETVTKRELSLMGYGDCAAVNGKIRLTGSVEDIYKLNFALRTGERVLILLAERKVTTFDELYDAVKRIEWHRFIPVDGRVVVSGKCVKSTLFAVSACQRIVKKAIADNLCGKYKVNLLRENGCVFDVAFSIHEDILVVTLDTTGEGLHKRGYRDLSVAAPMKETLAAAVVMLSDWGYKLPLRDLFCGSGTIPIEAALYARNIAPNIDRKFACDDWKGFLNGEKRKIICEELKNKELTDRKYDIMGCDVNHDCVTISRRHAKRAGVADTVTFMDGDARAFSSGEKNGTIISNLPYGERLMSSKELSELYNDTGKMFRNLDNWSGHFLTSAVSFEKDFGRKCDKKRKLFNGDIECMLYMYLKKRDGRR